MNSESAALQWDYEQELNHPAASRNASTQSLKNPLLVLTSEQPARAHNPNSFRNAEKVPDFEKSLRAPQLQRVDRVPLKHVRAAEENTSRGHSLGDSAGLSCLGTDTPTYPGKAAGKTTSLSETPAAGIAGRIDVEVDWQERSLYFSSP
ncbi:hypothetical protein JOQ06_028638 [Pogonophryne albipinna]|uniref:Uncharacterized protein n=1 Tax=Pogonophryne albipinna TaxID=1090488 RepID=A0AAD6FMQ0_9TELE|nr:hypothetical protein JOQ06_028638 [Pogonophryne albipinna]